MFWILQWGLQIIEKFCINVIKCGPVPKHVAFIMDGNRRFAVKNKMQLSEGHFRGFDKLVETLQWCLELGITEVTVYAFSIENFKRSEEEVGTLMRLATEQLQKLLSNEVIMAEGVRIRIIGNLLLLSEELQKLCAQVVLKTKDNDKAFVNVAFAYTSRDEIANAARIIVEGVKSGEIKNEDVDEDLIGNCLYTKNGADPDVIVRTSGEVRFSDFLLWQISNSQICFIQVLWPEFCIWDLLVCVFRYQRCCNELKKRGNKRKNKNERIQTFLDRLEQQRLKQL
ncbi:Prenyltransf domain containing protein [Asbolus verrucosus]|uniref:Alkyl transferase n=1 Tax=Asbolus verrucosus TaxID=1661398 RepID=A0A482WCT3_ASBVE|nr:Prenyltransf domain containing protein [Asbolus verrucosus]